jgi:hypothetical protein
MAGEAIVSTEFGPAETTTKDRTLSRARRKRDRQRAPRARVSARTLAIMQAGDNPRKKV